MKLTGQQHRSLGEAIKSAFGSWSELERALLFGCETRLVDITHPQKLDDVTFTLVTWAESRGQVVALVRGLRKQNPGNPALAAWEAQHLDGAIAPDTTTPAPETTTMPAPDLSTRAIHDDHRKGVVHLIRETLANVTPAQAETIRAHLFADDATYAELPDFSEEGARLAIRDALPGVIVPATRVSALVRAVRMVTPERRVCPTCGRLDLRITAAQWSPVTADYCPADHGVYARVAFPADVIAWTNGRTYPPGTTLDDDRLPITDAAIRAWAERSGAANLSAWTLRATEAAGVSLTEFAGYLLRTRTTTSPLATLDALVDPRREKIAIDADALYVLARRAKDAKTAHAAPPPAGTTVPMGAGRKYEGTQLRAIRMALVDLYPSASDAARIASDVGLRTSNIHMSGPAQDVWSNVLLEANKHGHIDAIVALARREYPRNTGLLALG